MWLLLLWLTFADRLPSDLDGAQSPLKEVYRLGVAFGSVGAAAALSFVAYLLGLSSVAIFGVIGRACSWFLIRVLARILQFGTYVFNRLVSKYRRSEKLQALAGYGNSLWSLEYEISQFGRSQRAPSSARKMAVRLLARRFRRDELFREAVIDAFPRSVVQSLVEEFQRTNLGDVSKWYRQEARVTAAKYQVDPQAGPADRQSDALDELWSRLVAVASWNKEAAEFLFATAIEGSPPSLASIVDLEHDLRMAPARLAVSAPPAYERWDRLSGEAEFRLALVPPLIGLLSLALLKDWISPPLGAGLLAFVVTLFVLGLLNARRAHEQLEVAIEARVIESSAFDELSTMANFLSHPEGSAKSIPTDHSVT